MKERPIIFSTPMVQAILDGRKTQTRRVVKQKLSSPTAHQIELEQGFIRDRGQNLKPIKCPYGKPGDRLWVRETFCVWSYDNNDVWYKASPISSQGWHNETLKNNGKKWKPSIHMPKKYARIWLEVTGVRVERVQEITVGDALSEGVGCDFGKHFDPQEPGPEPDYLFSKLWDSINGKKEGCSWAENPWVFVISFKVIKT